MVVEYNPIRLPLPDPAVAIGVQIPPTLDTLGLLRDSCERSMGQAEQTSFLIEQPDVRCPVTRDADELLRDIAPWKRNTDKPVSLKPKEYVTPDGP
jgi:hypothetical protein